MCRIKCEHVMDGPGPQEQVVRVKQATGVYEEVIASRSSISQNMLETSSVLARDDGKVLIELPRESASGKWRLWINSADTQG
jgi:hypothetical protein